MQRCRRASAFWLCSTPANLAISGHWGFWMAALPPQWKPLWKPPRTSDCGCWCLRDQGRSRTGAIWSHPRLLHVSLRSASKVPLIISPLATEMARSISASWRPMSRTLSIAGRMTTVESVKRLRFFQRSAPLPIPYRWHGQPHGIHAPRPPFQSMTCPESTTTGGLSRTGKLPQFFAKP